MPNMTNFRNLGSSRLDAVQGNSEARTELYVGVLRRSTGAVDEVMRKKLGQSFVLCTKAGLSGGGV